MQISQSKISFNTEHQLAETSWKTLEVRKEPVTPEFAEQLRQFIAAKIEKPPEPQVQKDSHVLQRQSWQSLLELLFDTQPTSFPTPSHCDKPSLPSARPAEVDLPDKVLTIETKTVHVATESCSFQSSGKVCLSDGSERQFAVDYTLARSELYATQTRFQMIDPLVLDLDGVNSSFGAQQAFDLDSDGHKEMLNLPDAPLLFVDQNGNGVADNGSELFGPRTGQGFAELAALDSDKNGWLDAGDGSFGLLNLWFAGQNTVQTLAQAGIGALSVNAVGTPFEFKSGGQLLGRNIASGVWLGEEQGAGSIRQIDLASKSV
ncbi:FG-GAP repeat domain-containing protein [Chitinibacter sp. S2-10]|uniref:FG-GAP repeat domain-containing protein n=1 Tax=Chitinibacter sp. S2-10 TaxID=3373597 RepID=UPI00397774DD